MILSESIFENFLSIDESYAQSAPDWLKQYFHAQSRENNASKYVDSFFDDDSVEVSNNVRSVAASHYGKPIGYTGQKFSGTRGYKDKKNTFDEFIDDVSEVYKNLGNASFITVKMDGVYARNLDDGKVRNKILGSNSDDTWFFLLNGVNAGTVIAFCADGLNLNSPYPKYYASAHTPLLNGVDTFTIQGELDNKKTGKRMPEKREAIVDWLLKNSDSICYAYNEDINGVGISMYRDEIRKRVSSITNELNKGRPLLKSIEDVLNGAPLDVSDSIYQDALDGIADSYEELDSFVRRNNLSDFGISDVDTEDIRKILKAVGSEIDNLKSDYDRIINTIRNSMAADNSSDLDTDYVKESLNKLSEEFSKIYSGISSLKSKLGDALRTL